MLTEKQRGELHRRTHGEILRRHPWLRDLDALALHDLVCKIWGPFADKSLEPDVNELGAAIDEHARKVEPPQSNTALQLQAKIDEWRRVQGTEPNAVQKRTWALELGHVDRPAQMQPRYEVTAEELAAARTRFEATFTGDWRAMPTSEQVRWARQFREEDRKGAPDTRTTDELKATGREPTVSERLACHREGNAA